MPEEAAVADVGTATVDPNQLADFSAAAEAWRTAGEPKPEAQVAPTPAPPAQPTPTKPVETAKPEAKPEQAIPEQILTGEKPEPAKPEEDALELEPPPNLSKQSAKNWQRMRDHVQRVQTERDAIRKDLEAAKAVKPGPDEQTTAQLKAAQERAAELERIVERAAFEQSPRYQQYLTREKQNIDGAKAYLEGTEINPNAIDLAAKATPSQRLKILRDAGMDAETIASVSPYLADIDRVNAEKTAAVSQYKEFRDQDAAQEKAQQEAAQVRQKEEEARIFKTVGESIATKFTPFQKVDGQDKWNAQVDQLQAEANEFFAGKLPLEKLAEIAYAGVAYKVEAQINQSLREANKALRTENAQLKAAQPDGGVETPRATPDPNAPWNPADAATAFERNLRAQTG